MWVCVLSPPANDCYYPLVQSAVLFHRRFALCIVVYLSTDKSGHGELLCLYPSKSGPWHKSQFYFRKKRSYSGFKYSLSPRNCLSFYPPLRSFSKQDAGLHGSIRAGPGGHAIKISNAEEEDKQTGGSSVCPSLWQRKRMEKCGHLQGNTHSCPSVSEGPNCSWHSWEDLLGGEVSPSPWG